MSDILEATNLGKTRFLSFTMADLPVDQLDIVMSNVLSRIARDRFRRSEGNFFLSRIYEGEPLRGGAHLFKVVIYSSLVAQNRSIIITNLADGWNSLAHLVAREHNCFQIQIISTLLDVLFPINRFEVWRSGVSVRSVLAMRDTDEWKFFQKGEPEFFEDKNYYNTKLKKNKLNREIIVRYIERIGINIRDERFWRANDAAIYYEESRSGRPSI